MCRLISERVRTARKLHECFQCAGPIRPGERYGRQFISDGAQGWTIDQHVECRDAARACRDYQSAIQGEDCVTYTLLDWADDSGATLANLQTLGLSSPATARIRHMWRCREDWRRDDGYEGVVRPSLWADDGGLAL